MCSAGGIVQLYVYLLCAKHCVGQKDAKMSKAKSFKVVVFVSMQLQQLNRFFFGRKRIGVMGEEGMRERWGEGGGER